jgi:hypothetical protein
MKIIIIGLLFIHTSLFAQKRAILKPNGEIEYFDPPEKSIPWLNSKKAMVSKNISKEKLNKTMSVPDTLGYDGDDESSFGIADTNLRGMDRMLCCSGLLPPLISGFTDQIKGKSSKCKRVLLYSNN